jgi:signal transduction histidine kinase
MMRRLFGPQGQITLVVLLFLGSLAVLLYNLFATLWLPRQELQVREQLKEAAHRMSEAAVGLRPATSTSPQSLNASLREIAARVLAAYPGVEGGFTDGAGWFGGYAYPSKPHAGGEPITRNDPPPLEGPYIQSYAEQSLDSGEAILRTLDVGPSRVAIIVEPVDKTWPSPLAVWLMYRLTGPEQMARQLRGYVTSTVLSLGGVALALVLAWTLTRALRRQRQEEERLRDDLRRAEHLAGLGTLLAGVAHEVRNPLAAIRSTVQLWQRLPDDSRTAASLDAVVAAVDRLNGLVSRLLFFARADSAERQALDLNQVLAESLELVQAQAAGQGVAVERDLAADLPAVLGSPAALRQVALNLLTNALQAMPQGGRLRCSTRRLPTENAVEIQVADTGSGVSAEVRQHLFEPFHTSRPEGTGLGLALCREILSNHGGRIELVDGEAPGAVFRCVLPATERT